MKRLLIIFFVLYGFHVFSQEENNDFNKVVDIVRALNTFSQVIPHEKVTLHFDNTSYYQGDNIWFKCYVVTPGQLQLSELSKTLYVELLNPGGDIVSKRILQIENGQCHGDFSLTQLPFYSGFYEVRAYTRYMLNFGDDVIFSRLLPVFDRPKTEGNYEEKAILTYSRWGTGNYPMKRELPIKGKNVNLRFFPEGGNLIQGIESRVAFEVTDETGNPIDVTGVVVDKSNRELASFAALHEGRGVFTYTPDTEKREAVVDYAGRKYRFDIPSPLPNGVVMEVDNLTYADSIEISLRKTSDMPSEFLCVSVVSSGILSEYSYVYVAENELTFKIDKSRLPAGVSQIVLFNSKGEIYCDRLIFNSNNLALLDIQVQTDKLTYRPHELVNMELSISDGKTNPVSASFSLSIRDGANEIESNHTILTDLLLMSEIKGYVRNPSWYFEENDAVAPQRATLLDLLLMVQGWRRYSWKQMANVEPFTLNYMPEQGIETNGRVVSVNFRGNQTPKSGVDVSMLLLKRENAEEEGGDFIHSFETDTQGRFSFVSDVEGRWNMILAATEKGKKKNYRILLDRVFSPVPKRYSYADLQVYVSENAPDEIPDKETLAMPEDDDTAFFKNYLDSLAQLGIDEQIHYLPEVTVIARRRTAAQDIYQNRSTSVVSYDVASEADDLFDRGEFIGNNINDLMVKMNDDFQIIRSEDAEYLRYKGRLIIFIINYQPTLYSIDYLIHNYKNINLSSIKSIYINETKSVMAQYIQSPSPLASPQQLADNLSCAVFIETYPDGEIPVEGAIGVRKTWLEGYSAVSEFYNVDYSELPPSRDYRRTLYWNPSVTPDENGIAKIQFYNNSSSRNFNISAETVTPSGMIGIN